MDSARRIRVSRAAYQTLRTVLPTLPHRDQIHVSPGAPEKAGALLLDAFPTSWKTLDLGDPATSRHFQAVAQQPTRHASNQRPALRRLAYFVCQAAASDLSKFPNIGFWLGQLSLAEVQYLPPRVFENRFPETAGGVLNAMAYGMQNNRNGQPQVVAAQEIFAYYLGELTPRDLDPNRPLTGSLTSYMIALASGRKLRRRTTLRNGSATTPIVGARRKFNDTDVSYARSALNAYQTVMPDTPVVRVDFPDLERERIRADALRDEAFEQRLPDTYTVHDFLSFARAFWHGEMPVPRPELAESTIATRLSKVRGFLRAAIVRDENASFEETDLPDVDFSVLEDIARDAGVGSTAVSLARTTFDAWNRFLQLGEPELPKPPQPLLDNAELTVESFTLP